MTSKKTPTPKGQPPAVRRYRVLTDRLTYYPEPGGDRIRPGKGAVIDDFQPSAIDWLLEAGAIEEVK